MVGLGVLLVIFGVGSLLLPMFDLQFRIMSILDDYQPIAGAAVAIVGAALLAFGLRRRQAAAANVAPERPAAQEPPAA